MMKFGKKIIFLFVCIFIVTTYMGHVVAVLYAEDVLDKIRTNPTKTDVQIRAELERLQQIAKNKKQKDVEQQLANYIKKYFPAGPVRILGENEIVLQKPRDGETYVLRPTSETERAEGQGDWRQVRQEGLVLLENAPAGSVAKPTVLAADRDKGDYYWNEREGIWVFVSNKPIQISMVVSESVAPAPTVPISESVVIAEAVSENVPAAPAVPREPSIPFAPPAPVAPAIPGAPPVPVAPPIAPNVPGAPPAPAAPVPPISVGAPPKKQSGRGKRVKGQEEKKELETLSEAAQQALSDEQKNQSDRLLVDTLTILSRTCVKPTPGEMYPVTLENYKKSVKAECSGLLKNELFFKRAELTEIRDRKFDLFLQDNALDNLDAVNDNFDEIVSAGVDMFSSALFDRTMMSEQAVRYLVIVFACLYRNPQNEIRFDASMNVSNYHVIAATEQSHTVEQLIDRLIMLGINREFLHYKRPSDNPPFYLLDSWLNEEDSKPKEIEKPGEPWKIPLLHVLAKPEFYNKGAVLGIVKRLVSTMREQLLYEEFLDLEDEERLQKALVLVIGNYQRATQPVKVSVPQGVVDIDALLNWNNIETFVDLESALRKIAKQVSEKEKKVDLEKLSEVIKVSPDKVEEVKKLYKKLFKDSGIGVDALYAKHQKEVEVVRILRLTRARSQKIRAEAEGLKKANKFAEAERLLAAVYQGALLYAELKDIYEGNLPGFVTEAFTELYRRSDTIYKVLDTLIKKSVGSLSALGFSKEDFALMIEPYGLLLMMLAEFNKTKEYQKLVNGLIALDTATKKADEESFDAVINNKDYIHDITTYALYKNRLKKLRTALDNFDIKGASTAIKQLVRRADLYIIKNPVRGGAADVDAIKSAGIDITQHGNLFLQYKNFSWLVRQVEDELARVFYAKIISRIQALSQGGISEKAHAFKLPEPSEHTGWTRKLRDPYLLVAIVKAQVLRPLQQVFVGKTIMDSGLIEAVDTSLADLQKVESLQAVVRKTLEERWSGAKPDNYQEILAAEVALIVAYIQGYLKLQRDVLEKVQSAVPPVKRISAAEQEAESKARAEQAWEEDVEARAALMGF